MLHKPNDTEGSTTDQPVVATAEPDPEPSEISDINETPRCPDPLNCKVPQPVAPTTSLESEQLESEQLESEQPPRRAA